MNKGTSTYRRKMLLPLRDIPTSSEPKITTMKGSPPNHITAVWSNKNRHINDQHSIITGKRKAYKGI